MVVVKRALVSCYDKSGIETFAKGLVELGIDVVASSGTATLLREHGLPVKSVEEFAGIIEQLDGRVKTLHPRIHAGILAKRDVPAHVQAVGAEGLIDLVVVNLYPFQETSQRPQATLPEVLEQIDIGGVALLRAAAKNFPSVAVVSDATQYPEVLAALRAGQGRLAEGLGRRLASAAFALTSDYDRLIAAYLAAGANRESPRPSTAPDALPERLAIQARRHQILRYGENAHQQAAWYVPLDRPLTGLATLSQLQGKALSYNNLLDLDAALRCVLEFERPACAIVKHASPCAIATAATLAEAYQRAYAADSESAFGGIIAVNRPLDAATAAQMAGVFLEVIVAPTMEPDAVARFAKKPNLRLITLAQPTSDGSVQWRSVLGGWLVQEPDRGAARDAAAFRVVTKRQPSQQELRDLAFAWTAAAHVKSNAIILARDGATISIGQGQSSRVRAVQLAIHNAGERCRGAVLASDGFFPFADNVEFAAKAGVAAVIQPGGSVNDAEVIAATDHAGMAMVFTGIRHFKH